MRLTTSVGCWPTQLYSPALFGIDLGVLHAGGDNTRGVSGGASQEFLK